MGEHVADLQRFIDNLNSCGKMIGLNINIKKTMVMADFPINISLQRETMEQVDKSVYLGSTFVVNKANCSEEILSQIGK